MYLCLERNGTELWVEPQGRSLYAIATLYQRGNTVDFKFINNKLLIKLYNRHKYVFSVGKKYNLFLECDNMRNLQITLKFDKGDYVAEMYYNEIDTIKSETWKILQPRGVPECPMLEICENHWYAPDPADSVEESDLDLDSNSDSEEDHNNLCEN